MSEKWYAILQAGVWSVDRRQPASVVEFWTFDTKDEAWGFAQRCLLRERQNVARQIRLIRRRRADVRYRKERKDERRACAMGEA